MTHIDSILERLTALHPKRIDLSLGRVERLLAALGSPEKKLPPVIHVAGTNGKGSTVTFLRTIMEAAGLRVHTYTSPHLVRFNERFRLGEEGEGKLVSDEALAAAMEQPEAHDPGVTIQPFHAAPAAVHYDEHALDMDLTAAPVADEEAEVEMEAPFIPPQPEAPPSRMPKIEDFPAVAQRQVEARPAPGIQGRDVHAADRSGHLRAAFYDRAATGAAHVVAEAGCFRYQHRQSGTQRVQNGRGHHVPAG